MNEPLTDSMPQASPRPFPGLIQAIIMLVIIFIFQIGIGVVWAVVLVLSRVEITPGDPAIIGVVNMISFGVVLLWVKWWFRESWNKLLPFNPFPATIILPLIPLVLGMGVIVSEVDNLLRFWMPVPDFITRIMAGVKSGGLATFIVLILVAPLTEELMFRGVILKGFLKRYSVTKAIVYSAVIFALFHINPYQYFGGLMIGLLAGLLLVRTRSLYPCLLVHGMCNAGTYLGEVLPMDIPGFTGVPGEISPGVFQPLWFNAVGVTLFVIGCVGLMKVLPRNKDRVPGISPI